MLEDDDVEVVFSAVESGDLILCVVCEGGTAMLAAVGSVGRSS